MFVTSELVNVSSVRVHPEQSSSGLQKGLAGEDRNITARQL
jgi:hypothetical protein